MIQRLFLRPEPFIRLPGPGEEGSPIFIVGAPRSGSTLLFQLLIMKYRVSYTTNLMALLPMFASRIAGLFKDRILGYDALKKSTYGVIRGLHAPNEGGKINDFWFAEDAPEARILAARKSILRTSGKVKAPFLVKSLGNSLRIEQILKVFPDARFIHLTRDPLYNAQSILLARKDLTGSIHEWVSIRPEGYEAVQSTRDPYYQVLWQLKTVHEQVVHDLEKFDPPRITLAYKDLCAATGETLEKIASVFDLSLKGGNIRLPDISRSESIRLDDADWQNLVRAKDVVFDH